MTPSMMSGHATRQRAGRLILGAYVIVVALFLIAPIVAITAGSLTTTSYVVFPPKGITLKWYLQIFNQPEFLSALGLSLAVAAAAATLATLLGLVVSLAMHRYQTRLNLLVQLLVMTPIMLPSVFLGLALLVMYSLMGLSATSWGLLAGHIMMVTPFTVSMIMVGLGSIDPTLERAARSLGATPWRTLLHVTLGLIAWSLAAGWGFAFMMSFGSLEVSLFLTTPTMVTLPVKIYSALEWSPLDPPLTAVSSGLVIITLIVLLLMARFVRIDRLLDKR
jgi:putative spermidine/putrescine transport system permease protein